MVAEAPSAQRYALSREDVAALPPGPRGPAARNLLHWLARPLPFMERCRERYGDRFAVDMGRPERWWVFMADPEGIKAAFTAPADVARPGEGSWILEPIVGSRSLLLLDGAEHLATRRMMLPAFHGERVQALTDLVAAVARAEVESWRAGEVVELHGALQQLTLDVILRAVFGTRPGPRHDALRAALTEVLEFGTSAFTLLPAFRRDLGGRTPWGRFQRALARSDALLDEVVADARPDSEDVLSMLLAGGLAGRELRDELMTLLVAGHETTASALAWAVDRLLERDELAARTAAAADDDDREWLDAVVLEALRRRPVLPIAMPRRLASDHEVGGVRHPAGAALVACIYLVHHDPRIYPEPYAFRPERWLDRQPGTYTWIPFGGGMRRCLGASFAQLEMRLVLRELFRAWEVERAAPGLEHTRRRSITLSPGRGTPVRLRPRTAPRAVPLAA